MPEPTPPKLPERDGPLPDLASLCDFEEAAPLRTFLLDPRVAEVMVNGPEQVYIEREGRLQLSPAAFDAEQLERLIERIVSTCGRDLSERQPYADVRLADGTRIVALIKPVALRGPYLNIRRFSRTILTMDDLVRLESITLEAATCLQTCVRERANVIIGGPSSAGKTTLLNILLECIPQEERVVAIEHSSELALLDGHHMVCLETRRANLEGQGEITVRELLQTTLLIRPDRIIIGEVRGPEAFDFVQAMSSGHEGSITTVHGRSGEEALFRLQAMALLGGVHYSSEAMTRLLLSTVDLIVQLQRTHEGGRYVSGIFEVNLGADLAASLTPVFLREDHPDSPGVLKPTGVIPRCLRPLHLP